MEDMNNNQYNNQEDTAPQGENSSGNTSSGEYQYNYQNSSNANAAPGNGAPANGAPTNGASTNGAPANGAPQGEYHYSYKDTSKWQPDPGKYNSQPPKQKKSKWWIPVVAGCTVLVAAIVAAAVIGTSMLKSMTVERLEDQKIISGQEEDEEIIAAEEKEDYEIVEKAEEYYEYYDYDDDYRDAAVTVTDVSSIVEETMPCVVSITSRTLVTSGGYRDFFNRTYGGTTEEVDSGLGSGTIVGQNDEELLILTSYHVVEDCSSLYVTFCDENSVDGYVKSADETIDIAIVALKLADIETSTLKEIKIATLNGDDVEVGEGVIVIGNALGYGQSVVTGIVSAKDRTFSSDGKTMTVIQTDAAINNGNSGGCMLDADGRVIGISEAKITLTAVEGVCYAISIHAYYDEIMDMLAEAPAEQEETTTETTKEQTAYIGVQGRDIDEATAKANGLQEGIYVLRLVSGGGAEKAGIEEGDIIISMDGKAVTSMSELQSLLCDYDPGDEVKVTVLRLGSSGVYEEVTVKVTLQSMAA